MTVTAGTTGPPPVSLHPTRVLLLDAGLRLAARTGLSQMSVEAVTAEAGVAKGTYYVHFRDRGEFLRQLYLRWHSRLMAALRIAVAGHPAGAVRLQAATTAYLDTLLSDGSARAILLAARSEPSLVAEVDRATADSAESARLDFAALGHQHPGASARLFVAMTVEAAVAELELGRQDPAMRATLTRFAQGT